MRQSKCPNTTAQTAHAMGKISGVLILSHSISVHHKHREKKTMVEAQAKQETSKKYSTASEKKKKNNNKSKQQQEA
jgi:hypothetical protein